MRGPFRGRLAGVTLIFTITILQGYATIAPHYNRSSHHEARGSLLPSCLQLEHATTEHQLAHLRDLIQVGAPPGCMGGSSYRMAWQIPHRADPI